MLDGADENPQLSVATATETESGPRHLRPRRGRHAARLSDLSASLTARLTRARREAYLLPVDPSDRMRRGLTSAAVLTVAAFALTAVPLPGQTPDRPTTVSLASDADDRGNA